jgi:hypothetical protein
MTSICSSFHSPSDGERSPSFGALIHRPRSKGAIQFQTLIPLRRQLVIMLRSHRFTSLCHHRFRKRHSTGLLQSGAPIVRRSQSTLADGNLSVRRLVVSFRTHSLRQRSFILLAAIIAAQHFLFVYRDRDCRLPCVLRKSARANYGIDPSSAI